MGYLSDLYETQIYSEEILPVSHWTANAQIEILLDIEGNFIKAFPIEKSKQADGQTHVTIIPATEDSANRAGSAISPHPLHDKLSYIAGDYIDHIDLSQYDPKKSEREATNIPIKYEKYIEQLENWVNSPYSTPEILSVYTYVKKGTLISDLVKNEVISLENGYFSDQKIAGIEQKECFVRFNVEPDGFSVVTPLYKDKRIYEVFTSYMQSLDDREKTLCYVSGNEGAIATKHASKLRHSGDKAKLISSNDTSGFTFRGRLSEANHAASVSSIVSEQAHNNLRYLIQKQGFSIGELTIIAWEKDGNKILAPLSSTEESFFDEIEEEPTPLTNEAYADKIRKVANGYYADLSTKSEIVVLALEAATVGRLSVAFYETFSASDFYKNLMHWHSTCYWNYFYYSLKDKKRNLVTGAPSPKELSKACFGDKNEKTTKACIARLLPCIVDRKRIPRDLVHSAVIRSANPQSYDSKGAFTNQVAVTCSLIHKMRNDYFEEDWSMALDKTCTERSYLFGRLLAACQRLEEVALGEEKRSTAAERFMSQFVKTPYKTLGLIEGALIPYKSKLKSTGKTYEIIALQEIYNLFSAEDFESNKPLSELYLLGYNCQMSSYFTKKTKEENENELHEQD